jgi:hypothetical protein
VTVCIAAMCEHNRIIGVSDRMITSDDIEFEPPQSKMWRLTPSIFVLTAGDTTLHAEILNDVEIDVVQRVVAEPANWWRVRDVAELYRGWYEEISLRRAESVILKPLGLDVESFKAEQSEMDPSLVARIASDLSNYELPPTQAIIIGVDNDGPLLKSGSPGAYPHIYVSKDGRVACYDTTGFAAIGYGDWHAQSQFMFAKHWRGRPLPETLLLAYSAKKHAEVAPGVGKDTDMMIVGPGLGNNVYPVGDHVMAELERVYSETRAGIDELQEKAEAAFRVYTEGLNKKSNEPQSSSETNAANKPTSE